MPGRNILTVEDLVIRYGDTVAVDGVCLEIGRGEVFGLLGPNGSGKSTTLAAVAGSVTPVAGSIRLDGLCPRQQPLAYRRLLGLVPQELAFYEELSAEDNLLFFGRLYGLRGRELRARVGGALELARLTEQARKPARTYSGGMQRRLNFACAVLHEPALLLLDEPTVALDGPSRAALFSGLGDLQARGCAIIFTTHHLAEAGELCDRMGIMQRGRLVAVGTLSELLADANPPVWNDTDTPRLEAVVGAGAGRGRREP